MARRKLNVPTSYDVARHAGVSQAVVSRAFQPVSPISAATRARVLASAAELGYQPNAIARSLITQRSGLVGIVLTEATFRHTPDVLFLLGRSLMQHGFQPLLFPCMREGEGSMALDKALAHGVDGVISCVGLTHDDLSRAQSRQRPVVLFNRDCDYPVVLQVTCDHAGAARLLASRLYAAGHRRFAVVSGPADAPVSSQRVGGFVDRLRELGVSDVAVFPGDYQYESGHAAGLQLLAARRRTAKPQRPEVVFCANDEMALGVLDAARFALLLRVPLDVSVVGFDDIPAGRRPAYLLTTVSQPFEDMAQVAVELLRHHVEHPCVSSERHVVTGSLIERGSAQLLPEHRPPADEETRPPKRRPQRSR